MKTRALSKRRFVHVFIGIFIDLLHDFGYTQFEHMPKEVGVVSRQLDGYKEKFMGNVLSIHISDERGTTKTDVAEVKVLEGWGLQGDAHGGECDRQVAFSLLRP